MQLLNLLYIQQTPNTLLAIPAPPQRHATASPLIAMPPHCTHVSAVFDRTHDLYKFRLDTTPKHCVITVRTHRTHPHPQTPTLFTKSRQTNINGIDYDPPQLPRARASRPRNPLIRLPFTLRSLSQFHPLPRPTSPSPLSISPPKPVPTLMKSHAAPNFSPKPLFYPEDTPTPFATSRVRKHSPDPTPPSPAPTKPHTPSNR